MISWIQKNLQGHFRYVFLVLLAATIIMFVFTIGNQGWGSGGDSRKQYVQSFFDLDLGKPADQARLIGDAAMSVRLQAGYDLFHGAQLQQYALRRYALIHIASTLGLPPPDVNEVAAHIAGMGLFAGQDGKFDEKRYNEFRDSLRTNPGAGEGDINRVIVDDMRARSAETLLAGPGYALSGDVKRQLVRADTEWTIGLATVDFAGFAPEIPVTDALLEAFLQKNPAAYEIPAMARVACVEFKAADFAAEV
ncbi:MAG: SurA N-terminal domain-containing protein, partial [Opitutaceae bacterium]|nr:SurA N-terminal domain-containing protein [Opitutaceae bacterium]